LEKTEVSKKEGKCPMTTHSEMNRAELIDWVCTQKPNEAEQCVIDLLLQLRGIGPKQISDITNLREFTAKTVVKEKVFDAICISSDEQAKIGHALVELANELWAKENPPQPDASTTPAQPAIATPSLASAMSHV
jgi:hypothetical protein